jgi:lipopolysaccharide export system permease protein
MFDLSRGRLAIKYIVFELLPIFIVGMSIFILILVMIQSFKLSEYIIVHGAPLATMTKLVFFMTLGYLPILFPVALLFAVLMVYGRLSADSEIVALKALGLTPLHLTTPSLIVGIVIALLSLQTSFRLSPWGQRNLEEMINILAQTRPGAALREGVFSDDFFDLVVYAHDVDSKTGQLSKVFIYDERDAKSPVTIIAKQGQILNSNSIQGQEASIRLMSGNVHKSTNEFYTKINFGTYDINLFDPHNIKEKELSPDALNLSELRTAMAEPKTDQKRKTNLVIEWHRRWVMSAACLIFAFLGVSLGAITNRRAARSSSLLVCITVIIVYWTLSAWLEAVGRGGHLPLIVTAWIPNLFFLSYGAWQFRHVVRS